MRPVVDAGRRRWRLGVAIALSAVAVGLAAWWSLAEPTRARGTPEIALIAHPRTVADRIVNAAKREVRRGVRYDAAYVRLSYPGGDVAANRGACTDVIIQGLRNGGYDLQQLMHEDMERRFSAYPNLWGLRAPDANIDHRRVANHIAFMRRHGRSLPLSTAGRAAATWRAGDLVYWNLSSSGPTHCGVISDERGRRGLPLVIHNIGPVATQEDCLDRWEIIGHFRYPPPRAHGQPVG